MKKMKKRLAMILCVVLSVGVLAGCSGSSGGTASEDEGQESSSGNPTYSLKFAYTLATDHDLSLAFEQFAEDVYNATDGDVEITTYPAGSLGTQTENLESVMQGSLDMCYADTSMLVTYVPEYTLISLPWLITSFDTANEIFYESDIVDSLDAILSEETNMTSLGWVYQGFRVFASTMPLTNKESCQGVKMRSPETQIYIDTFSEMGFSPSVITWTEAYTAMQSGVVDGLDTIKSSMISYGITDIADYIWNSNHMFSSAGIVINSDVLAGLPEEYQETILNCWADVTEWFNEDEIERDASYVEQFEEAGVTVTYTEDEQEFRDIFHDYWYESAEENGYTELLDEMMKIIEEQ